MRLVYSLVGIVVLVGLGWGISDQKSFKELFSDSQAISEKAEGDVSLAVEEDPYAWLEEVEGERAISWVKDQNKVSADRLKASPMHSLYKKQALAIMNDKDKLPYVRIRGPYVYNLWRDENSVRGKWRRMPLESYLAGKADWELLLDVDALGKKEAKSYVFKGATCFKPDYERCLLSLSDGGKDSKYLREFDVKTKTFVKDGFQLGEAKGSASWLDQDTVLIASAFNKEDQTASGYGRRLYRWRRGESYDQAKLVLEAEKDDIFVWSSVEHRQGQAPLVLVGVAKTFYQTDYYAYKDGKTQKLKLPNDIRLSGVIDDRLIFSLKTDGLGQKQGDLVAVQLDQLLSGKAEVAELIFRPTESQAVTFVKKSGNHLLLFYLDDVRGRAVRFSLVDGAWNSVPVPMPETGTVGLMTSDEDKPRALVTYQDFLTPTTVYYLDLEKMKTQAIRSAPQKFDAAGLKIEQYFAESKDGTRVPYYVVHKKDLKFTGDNPTLLYGYGGFEISLTPRYSGVLGKLWLEQGGVYVLANIRGGGEFGPKWHQAALKEKRQKAFDDFIAVAEDLMLKKVTNADHLAIKGGSNGGLLMGTMLTQRPDLFKGVICEVPLLDMIRYHKLLAGASWVAEYGNPDDVNMRSFLLSYSPYHNLKADQSYPEVFFVTSTKDDRVHPGHARKMAAKMLDMGHQVLFYENIEGGHGVAADNLQMAERVALQYVYLWTKLNKTPLQSN